MRDGKFKPTMQVADSMKAYRVSGIAPFGSVRNKFSLDLPAESKDAAEHLAYSILGSRHKAKRRAISIDSIKEIDPRWVHPIFKKNVDFLINQLSQNSRIEITRLRKSVII